MWTDHLVWSFLMPLLVGGAGAALGSYAYDKIKRMT